MHCVRLGSSFSVVFLCVPLSSDVSKDEAQACEIDELVEKKFEGSLPAFIAAFTKHQAMSEDELDEMQRMIDRIRKEGSQ